MLNHNSSNSERLGELINLAGKMLRNPRLCVGFGISTPEQAKEVGKMADGVIVGSACVRTIGGSEIPIETAREIARSFREALNKK